MTVTRRNFLKSAATISSTTCWIAGYRPRGSITFGIALVVGRRRVPRPATGTTALMIGIFFFLYKAGIKAGV